MPLVAEGGRSSERIRGRTLAFALLFALAGRHIMRWATEYPHKPQLVSGLALLGGGAFFVYYWGLAFLFDIGQWGMKLGWYG